MWLQVILGRSQYDSAVRAAGSQPSAIMNTHTPSERIEFRTQTRQDRNGESGIMASQLREGENDLESQSVSLGL